MRRMKTKTEIYENMFVYAAPYLKPDQVQRNRDGVTWLLLRIYRNKANRIETEQKLNCDFLVLIQTKTRDHEK